MTEVRVATSECIATIDADGPDPLGGDALETYAVKNKFDKGKNGVTIPPDDHYRPPAQVFHHSDVRPYGRITEGYAYIND